MRCASPALPRAAAVRARRRSASRSADGCTCTREEARPRHTLEDTCCDQEILSQPDHKPYDEWSESVPEGTRFAS